MALEARSLPFNRRLKKWAASGLAISLLAFTAGCSAGADEPSGTSEPKGDSAETLKVGVSSSLSSTSLHLGVNEGIFEDAGLEVELTSITSMSEGVTQIMSGNLDYIFGDVHNTILAQSEGMPIVMAAPIIVAPDSRPSDGEGFGHLVVLKDSGIESPSDLAGKTIGTSSLSSTSRLDFQTILAQKNIDVSKLKWVAIPGPQQLAALRQGQVDAVTLPEPHVSTAIQEGDIKSVMTSAGALPGAPLYGMVAHQKWIASNSDTARVFKSAVIEANKKTNADRETANEVIASFTELPDALILELHLQQFAEAEFESEAVQSTVDRMVDFGLLEEGNTPDLNGLFAQL